MQKIAIGQVWKDNDKRAGNRRLEVTGFQGKTHVKVRNIATGSETRVSRKRLLSTGATGYTYIAKGRPGRKLGSGLDLETICMKATKKTHQRLYANAKRYARSPGHPKGNLSAWLRHTGLHYKPKKGEKISLDAA